MYVLVHEKYIKRGEKIHGPYFYKSYRDSDGKVKKAYLGRNFIQNDVTLQGNKRFTKGFYILVFFFVALALLSFVLERPSIIGHAVSDVDTFGINEPVIEDVDEFKIEEPIIEENVTEEIDTIVEEPILEENQTEIIDEDSEIVKEEDKKLNDSEVSFENDEFKMAVINLADCGNISEPGEYVLTADVTNESTCFSFESDDVSLDCAGFTITYNTGGLEKGYALNLSNATALNNITIANCIVQIGPFLAGMSQPIVYFSEAYNFTLHNNSFAINDNANIIQGTYGEDLNFSQNEFSFNNSGGGIALSYINNTNISESNITNLDIDYSEYLDIDSNSINGSSTAVSITQANFTNFTNNFVNATSTACLDVDYSIDANFSSNDFSLYGSSSGDAISLASSNSSTIIENVISTTYGNTNRDGIDLSVDDEFTDIEGNNITAEGISRGIFFDQTKNVTMVSNSIYTPNNIAFEFNALTINDFNYSIDMTNLAEGFPIIYNFSISDVNLFENEDLSSTYGFVTCAWCNNVTYNNINLSNDGMYFWFTENSTFTNLNISTLNGTAIQVVNGTDNVIAQNNILSNGTYITRDTYGVNTNFTDNIVTSQDSLSAGLYNYGSYNELISNNSFTVNSVLSYGLILYFNAGPSLMNVTENSVEVNSADSTGIYVISTPLITFYNNNISLNVNTAYSFNDNPDGIINYYEWENDFGDLKWTSSDMDINVTTKIGNNIFLENNLVGVTDNENRLDLGDEAEIQIKGLNYTSTPYLYNNTQRCDNLGTGVCNITYDVSSKILYANVSSFSNYTTDLEPVTSVSFDKSSVAVSESLTVTCSATDSGGNIANVSMSGDSQSCSDTDSDCSIAYTLTSSGSKCYTCTTTDTNNLQNTDNKCITVDITYAPDGGGGSGAPAAPSTEEAPISQQIVETPVQQEIEETKQEIAEQSVINLDTVPAVPLESVAVTVTEDFSQAEVSLGQQGGLTLSIKKTPEGILKPQLNLNFKTETLQVVPPAQVDITKLPFSINLGFFTLVFNI